MRGRKQGSQANPSAGVRTRRVHIRDLKKAPTTRQCSNAALVCNPGRAQAAAHPARCWKDRYKSCSRGTEHRFSLRISERRAIGGSEGKESVRGGVSISSTTTGGVRRGGLLANLLLTHRPRILHCSIGARQLRTLSKTRSGACILRG